MAKTKYIVPVVAMMLCVVSLIGAGYAAYNASLTDSETVTAENNYLELTLGDTTAFNASVHLAWDTSKAYANAAADPTTTWTLQDQEVDLGKFVVNVDNTHNDKTDVTAYNLTPSAITLNSGTPAALETALQLKVYSDSAGAKGTVINDTSALVSGTTYHVVLVYAHGSNPALSTTTAPTDLSITYTLTATAATA